jgi:hypothetical protein
VRREAMTGEGCAEGALGETSCAKMKDRCRANMAHTRQSRPDSGFGCQVNETTVTPLKVSPLGSGSINHDHCCGRNKFYYTNALPSRLGPHR